MARFYMLSLEPALFGEVAVLRHWGRIGTRGRQALTPSIPPLRKRKCRSRDRPPFDANGVMPKPERADSAAWRKM